MDSLDQMADEIVEARALAVSNIANPPGHV
jgi:hypothetical protein